MEKKVLVALDQKSMFVGRVFNVSEKEFVDLINAQNLEIEKQEREKAEMLATIENLKKEISLLKTDIRVLKGEDNDEESI